MGTAQWMIETYCDITCSGEGLPTRNVFQHNKAKVNVYPTTSPMSMSSTHVAPGTSDTVTKRRRGRMPERVGDEDADTNEHLPHQAPNGTTLEGQRGEPSKEHHDDRDTEHTSNGGTAVVALGEAHHKAARKEGGRHIDETHHT
eukprot:CAMPEP_0194512018 /NCGR_PEP_ID=MMETSP0253-20130528/43856_1 /TAXON_ID=2966 /ORGANISM="Noctiluca scintillans" /LENGTH=143 /DNA_ID=CAMNT_0039355415 /DNA_START=213 /DNA_END=646 /DNA_ORIENTATION=+